MNAFTDAAIESQARDLGSVQTRFETLLSKHRGIVFKVASIYFRDLEDQRDVAQEIRAQLWRAFPTFDESRSFSTWMYRIALNVAISSRRNAIYRHRHVEAVDQESLAAIPDQRVHEPDERLRDLYRVIDQLDDLHRALVLLHLEGRDYREIAEILGITETNVATKLNRLRQRLRKMLAGS